MAFPTNPSRGDTHVADSTTWLFNGRTWDRSVIRPGNATLYGAGAAANISSDDPAIVGADGGYEFTGGFVDRTSGSTGNLISNNVQYTAEQAANGTWRRFGFNSAQQQANDVAYFPVTPHHFDQTKGLFGGEHMPAGVTDLFDFDDTSLSSAVTTGDLQYTAATGSYDFRQCQLGDLAKVRFSFNVVPQQANTTVEVGLIWATRDSNNNVTFTFPLLTQPIFYGTGTVGKVFLNRVEMSAYFASNEDLNARVLPAIRADNEILIAPLTTLCTIVR